MRLGLRLLMIFGHSDDAVVFFYHGYVTTVAKRRTDGVMSRERTGQFLVIEKELGAIFGFGFFRSHGTERGAGSILPAVVLEGAFSKEICIVASTCFSSLFAVWYFSILRVLFMPYAVRDNVVESSSYVFGKGNGLVLLKLQRRGRSNDHPRIKGAE